MLRNWLARKNCEDTIIFMIIFITDTNQVRTITDMFITLQSGSTLYRHVKLTSAQYKHRYYLGSNFFLIFFMNEIKTDMFSPKCLLLGYVGYSDMSINQILLVYKLLKNNQIKKITDQQGDPKQVRSVYTNYKSGMEAGS